MSPPANSVAGFPFPPRRFSPLNMELDLQPGDVVKVLESAALGWVRARVIRVKSGGRVVVQSDQGREFTARGNQVRLIEPAGFRP
jgi:co-chaperonin GroES (HSP10)